MSVSVVDISVLEEGPVLLYDGECGVCSSSIQWILRHEKKRTLRFLPLESELGQHLRIQAGVPEGVDSLLWIESYEGQARARKWSDSVIAVLGYVGGPWTVLGCLRWIPRPARDLAYRTFAKHRLKIAPKSCLVPSPQTRTRFLDGG